MFRVLSLFGAGSGCYGYLLGFIFLGLGLIFTYFKKKIVILQVAIDTLGKHYIYG